MSIFEYISDYYQQCTQSLAEHSDASRAYIAEAAHLLNHTLMTGNKILCCAGAQNHTVALQFHNALNELHHSRPIFPCLLLGSGSISESIAAAEQGALRHLYSRNLQAFAQDGDALVIFSLTGEESYLQEAVSCANGLNLSLIIISPDTQLSQQCQSNHVQITVAHNNPSHTLILQLSSALLLAQSTEQLLFGLIE